MTTEIILLIVGLLATAIAFFSIWALIIGTKADDEMHRIFENRHKMPKK